MAVPHQKQILSSSGVSEGQWERVDGIAVPFTVIVYGFNAGDVAQLYVSNSAAQPPLAAPAAGDGTVKLGGDITADTGVVIKETWRWLRVRKSAAGGTPATTKADVAATVGYAL